MAMRAYGDAEVDLGGYREHAFGFDRFRLDELEPKPLNLIINYTEVASLLALECTCTKFRRWFSGENFWRTRLETLLTYCNDDCTTIDTILQHFKQKYKKGSNSSNSSNPGEPENAIDFLIATMQQYQTVTKNSGRVIAAWTSKPFILSYSLITNAVNHTKNLILMIKDQQPQGQQDDDGIEKYEELLEVYDLVLARYHKQLRTMFPVTTSDKVKVSPTSTMTDPTARRSWEETIGHKFYCSWKTFAKRLIARLFPNVAQNPIHLSYFSYVLDFPYDQIITCFKWDILVNTFGPFDKFLHNLDNYVMGKGFAGFITRRHAEELLTGKNDHVLFRFSRSIPGCVAFSYNDRGKFKHITNNASWWDKGKIPKPTPEAGKQNVPVHLMLEFFSKHGFTLCNTKIEPKYLVSETENKSSEDPLRCYSYRHVDETNSNNIHDYDFASYKKIFPEYVHLWESDTSPPPESPKPEITSHSSHSHSQPHSHSHAHHSHSQSQPQKLSHSHNSAHSHSHSHSHHSHPHHSHSQQQLQPQSEQAPQHTSGRSTSTTSLTGGGPGPEYMSVGAFNSFEDSTFGPPSNTDPNKRYFSGEIKPLDGAYAPNLLDTFKTLEQQPQNQTQQQSQHTQQQNQQQQSQINQQSNPSSTQPNKISPRAKHATMTTTGMSTTQGKQSKPKSPRTQSHASVNHAGHGHATKPNRSQTTTAGTVNLKNYQPGDELQQAFQASEVDLERYMDKNNGNKNTPNPYCDDGTGKGSGHTTTSTSTPMYLNSYTAVVPQFDKIETLQHTGETLTNFEAQLKGLSSFSDVSHRYFPHYSARAIPTVPSASTLLHDGDKPNPNATPAPQVGIAYMPVVNLAPINPAQIGNAYTAVVNIPGISLTNSLHGDDTARSVYADDDGPGSYGSEYINMVNKLAAPQYQPVMQPTKPATTNTVQSTSKSANTPATAPTGAKPSRPATPAPTAPVKKN